MTKCLVVPLNTSLRQVKDLVPRDLQDTFRKPFQVVFGRLRRATEIPINATYFPKVISGNPIKIGLAELIYFTSS